MIRHYMCERCGGMGKNLMADVPEIKCGDCLGVGLLGFAQTEKKTFFAAIGKEDCHPRVIGDFPYTSHFTTPKGTVLGACVGHRDEDGGEDTYFLPDERGA